jgi:hypothetical protein
MALGLALQAAEELRQELADEVTRSREERLVLRSLDGERIQRRLEERQAFQGRAETWQQRLREAQAAAARQLGLADPSAESIARASPREGGRLLELIGQVKALASTLGELTALNRMLAERALGCTRAYVQALAPRPTAYGRFGVPPPAPTRSAVSRRA